ncbi:DUF3040 domain-containing protein [Streptomonospora litoralis]|uniref:DUF3040 domain-containing protein n=1 Tax=Streptomonospora litoralis TaxID=2498135 RepID=A0A4P6Q1V5_9ACTN|nr:DUF3040 domain-containing protein [Streptomonospora litoralis]QBI54578.1 hypothetical protein EKD16_13985 [Streptomonospora litoralis]
MSLREYERRILAEMEHALAEDDPDLDGHLRSFGADDDSYLDDERPGRWLLWMLIGVAVLVLCAMLAGLYFSAPVQGTAPPTTPASPGAAQPGAGGGTG